MIPLTRGAVRSFLAVARRAAPTGRKAGFDPLVRIAAGADGVTLAVHYDPVVLGRRCPAVSDTAEEFVVPLAALKALDGRVDGPIELGPTAPDDVTARWTDAAGSHEVALPLVPDCSLTWPAEPKKLWPVKPDFPAALHEAGRTAAREAPNRYATDHVQVRGKAGQVIATDGRQALTLGGFGSRSRTTCSSRPSRSSGPRTWAGSGPSVSGWTGTGCSSSPARGGCGWPWPGPPVSRTSPGPSRGRSRPGSRSPGPTPRR